MEIINNNNDFIEWNDLIDNINKLDDKIINNIYSYIYPDVRLCIWMKKYNMAKILQGIIDCYMFGAIKIAEAFDRYFPDHSWDLYVHILSNKKWEEIKTSVHFLFENKHIDNRKFISDVLDKMDLVLHTPDGVIKSYKLAASYIFLHKERYNLKEPCKEDFIDIEKDIKKIQ